MSKTKGYCQICSEEIEVRMCCNGYECGCMGQPVDPPVCSNECYDQYMNNNQKRVFTTIVPLKKDDTNSYDYTNEDVRTDSLVPVRRGCENKECFCTGKCNEIITWRKKLPNEI